MADHSIPWLNVPLPPVADDRWELYHVAEDFSEANDLAAQNPQKLKELQDLFIQEAIRNHVLPIDDRRVERFDAARAGRPDLMGSRTSLTLYEGMTGITENAFINLKGRSYTITADIDVPPGGADGVIIAQAGKFGGWSLYMKDGRAKEVYNFGGLEWTTVSSTHALPPGQHTIRYEFIYDGGKPGSGGTSRLSAVTTDYKEGANRFSGRILKVSVSSGDVKLTDAEKEEVARAAEAAATAQQ